MSLSPNVTPFIPRQQSVVPSQQTNAYESSSWKLSADVAEFVPNRLKNGGKLPKNPTSNVTTTENTEPLMHMSTSNTETGDESAHKKISNVNHSKQKSTPKTYSFKTDSTANLSKKKYSLQKQDHQKTLKEQIPSKSNDENDIESDFPALGTSIEKPKAPWSQRFGMSFSEKLKSKNTSSYFYEEPPRLSNDKPLNEDQKQTMYTKGNENKAVNEHKKMVPSDRLKATELSCVLSKTTKNTVQSQSDDEGFSTVVNRAKKSREAFESKQKEDKITGRRRTAWDENDDNTKKTSIKGAINFPERQSTTSEKQRSARERRSVDTPRHNRGSSCADWRSGKNVTKKEREPRSKDTSNKGGSRTRQSLKPVAKDYYSLMPTHRVLENEMDNRKIEKEENVPKEATNIATVETRTPLSYSDILKSKPSQIQLTQKMDGKERGVLRVPSDASEDDGVDAVKVEEQEGKTKKKKKKKKKKSAADVTPQPVKKSKEMLTLDLSGMMEKVMESPATKRKQVIRTGGFLPAQAPLRTKETRTTKKHDLTHTQQAANALDSTAPIVFRSKEREFPKKKKPSAMRKILTKEREEKQMTRDGRSNPEESLDVGSSENESSEKVRSDSDEVDPAEVKKTLHSRKFREYCDQDLDYEINGVVIQLLKELIRFQDRQYQKDPVKAKAKRRFVCGLREVYKHAKLKKLKCVIVTPNLEPTKSKGGLDDLLSNIIDVCHSQNVPVIFSLNRQVLGRVLLKKVPVSIVGIFYYDGAQDYFKSLMILTKVARETYRDKFNAAREKYLVEKRTAKDEEQNKETIESTETEQHKDDTTENNDDENVQIKLAISEQVFGAEKTQTSSDLAVIGENIEWTEMERDEDKSIESEDDILAVNEQELDDGEKQKDSDLAVIEEHIDSSESEQHKDETIEKNDSIVAIHEQAFGDEEKHKASDLAVIKEDIGWSETKQHKSETIENNDDITVMKEQGFGDEEILKASDLSVTEKDIESSKMKKSERQTTSDNNGMNVESGFETILANKDRFEDEEQQMLQNEVAIETSVQLSGIQEQEYTRTRTGTENDDNNDETEVETADEARSF